MRTRRAALRAAAGAALFLAAGEVLVRISGVDDRLLPPLLYYQMGFLPVHQAVDDADLRYMLRPGARVAFDHQTVTVDSKGFRGAERSFQKKTGIFRIVCLGGSNTYGPEVNDDETYPAQLERELNGLGPRRYEVWNAGVPAYVWSQDVAAAEDAIATLHPDMLLFMRTNRGVRAFLDGQDPKPFFQRDPRLYAENLLFLPFAESSMSRRLMAHWRLYRAVILAANQALIRLEEKRWIDELRKRLESRDEATINRPAFSAFFRAHSARLKLIVLGHPGWLLDEDLDPSVPVIDLAKLLPPDAGAEYRKIHPPAYVYAWYARTIARELRRRFL